MSKNRYFDRDLSWLSFNYRVLLEAKDEAVPPLERLRFVAIYSSNLDEFFRVRVANLRRIISIGKKKINKRFEKKPQKLLDEIHAEVNNQLTEYGIVLNTVLEILWEHKVYIHRELKEVPDTHLDELGYYFRTKVLAYLKPKFIKEKPFLDNRALYFALAIRSSSGKQKGAVVNIPSNKLPRFYKIQESNGAHYYFLDDIIRLNLHRIFPDAEVLECCSIKLNKDADLQIDDEYSGDLVEKIEKQIQKRNLGDPSRFLYDQSMSAELLNEFQKAYGFEEDDLVSGGRYHNLNDFFQIDNPGNPALEYDPMPPLHNPQIDSHQSIFEAMEAQDQILHFPYQSYDYTLQFFNEAAIDPNVTEIYATFYRMAQESIIGEALISAATNGKKVRVFMEVKARFDEANNLRWASLLEEAGVELKYSMPGLKVHAKVALVKKQIGDEIKRYGFFGTGNLNESTAKIYCDYGLLSCHEKMTEELEAVFRFLHKRDTPDPFDHLIVSQFRAYETFEALINREIQNAQDGKEAKIIIKVNNLEEKQLIEKLYEAASSGVKVIVLARSICCLVPGTENIPVSRIVDRYLEHSRMFYFYNDGAEDLYLGSSDWMSRNIHRRVEVSFPIYDPNVKSQLLDVLMCQLRDDTKRVWLTDRLENKKVADSAGQSRAQLETYKMLKKWVGQ